MARKGDLALTDLSPGLRTAVLRFERAVREHEKLKDIKGMDEKFYKTRQSFLRKLYRVEHGIKLHRGGGRHTIRNT